MVDKKISIDGISLEYVSSVNGLTIADSFVKRENKIGTGNGEAKLYVGADSAETWDFFGGPSFEISCFLLKDDLANLLDSLRSEYSNPTQDYVRKAKFSSFLARREHLVAYLPAVLWFEVYEQGQIKGTRVYMKSDSSYFGLIRELCFPNITALDIHKYKNSLGHFFYYFDPHRAVGG
jgi:putative restriction endonuclease